MNVVFSDIGDDASYQIQAGATDLLGPKRHFVGALGELVGAVSAVRLAGLLAGATLMVKNFVFVKRVDMLSDILFRTRTFIELSL